MIRSKIRRPYTDVPFHIDSYGLGWFIGRYRGTLSVLCDSMAQWLAHLEFKLGDRGSNPGSRHYSIA